MADSEVRGVASSVSSDVGIVPFTHEIRLLAQDVGPAWGLVFVLAICVFFPRFGLAALFLRLWKEDRADDRRHKIEREKLLARYGKRPKVLPAADKPKALPAPRKKGDEDMAISLTVVAVLLFGLLGFAMHRSLKQRPMARHYRDKFSSIAGDLIGKPEIPDVLAKHLLTGASIPAGWLTRILVMDLFRRVITGRAPKKKSANALEFAATVSALPNNLKSKYVVCILSLVIADSYRSAFLGTIWRGINSWTIDAIGAIKVDVDAHATEQIVIQVARAKPPVWARYHEVATVDCIV